MPQGSPSVLIIRLDGIGDALALTPLLAAFCRNDISTDIVLQRVNAEIFSTRAARRIFVADFALRSSASPNLVAIKRFGEALRAHRYSHVLVATEDPGGYRLAAAVNAPARIGFADPLGKPFKALWSRRLLTNTIYRSAGLDPRGPHECEVLFGLGASLIGNERPTRDVAELRPLVLEREPANDDRIAVQITTKWERFGVLPAQVVELLHNCAQYANLQLFAAQREAPYAQYIAGLSGMNVTYFGALEPWKAAIAAAAVIVTPDSGALHVAGMVGTPVVAVFPAQRKYALRVARWAPWAASHRIVLTGDGWPRRAREALAQLLGA